MLWLQGDQIELYLRIFVNFFTKVAQIFGNCFDNFETCNFFSKLQRSLLGQLLIIASGHTERD